MPGRASVKLFDTWQSTECTDEAIRITEYIVHYCHRGSPAMDRLHDFHVVTVMEPDCCPRLLIRTRQTPDSGPGPGNSPFASASQRSGTWILGFKYGTYPARRQVSGSKKLSFLFLASADGLCD